MSRKKEQMYALVEAWQSGEQSKVDFCLDQQINVHTFTYWVQKYKIFCAKEEVEDGAEKFISLRVNGHRDLPDPMVELCYPNGVRLRIEGQACASYLESLIRIQI